MQSHPTSLWKAADKDTIGLASEKSILPFNYREKVAKFANSNTFDSCLRLRFCWRLHQSPQGSSFRCGIWCRTSLAFHCCPGQWHSSLVLLVILPSHHKVPKLRLPVTSRRGFVSIYRRWAWGLSLSPWIQIKVKLCFSGVKMISFSLISMVYLWFIFVNAMPRI